MPLSIEDRFAIEELVSRYNHATDRGDGEARAATFTEDGVFRATAGERRGREAIRAASVPRRQQHWVTNLLIDGEGDKATLSCYLKLFVLGKPRYVRLTGVYRDQLRKVDGEWLFAVRHFTRDQQPA